MKFLARMIRADEVRQEITQRDQFDTEKVPLPETLIRESLQNSMDAIHSSSARRVRIRISRTRARQEDSGYWFRLFEDLIPHLVACDISTTGLDFTNPAFLVIEDFGTTGLLGATNTNNKGSFCDFWRRNGISHKQGSKAGRWGLGKLVFSSASQIRTLFGFTIRTDSQDPGPYLMGQSVLKVHELDGVEYASHAFFAVPGAGGLQLPTDDEGDIQHFRDATGITRGEEAGMSIVVPFPIDSLTPDALLTQLIQNWYFPILMNDLSVDCDGRIVDADSFSRLSREFGGTGFQDGTRLAFLERLRDESQTTPPVVLDLGWAKNGVKAALGDDTIDELRSVFRAGKAVAVRAPITLRTKHGSVKDSFVDLYLAQAPEGAQGEGFYVRGTITIPGEARRFRGRDRCFGALLAKDEGVVAFLGDAEGPAHTTWSANAEKVKDGWKNPQARLNEIRDSLNQLYAAVAQPADTLDPDALKSLFHINEQEGTKAAKQPSPFVRAPVPPEIPKIARPYRLDRRQNGFVIRNTDSTEVGMTIEVSVAYDVATGKPLKDYSEFDFDFRQDDISIECTGALVEIRSGNRFLLEVDDPTFSVVCTGFDTNRDLYVKERLL